MQIDPNDLQETAEEGVLVVFTGDVSQRFPNTDGFRIASGGVLELLNGSQAVSAFAPGTWGGAAVAPSATKEA